MVKLIHLFKIHPIIFTCLKCTLLILLTIHIYHCVEFSPPPNLPPKTEIILKSPADGDTICDSVTISFTVKNWKSGSKNLRVFAQQPNSGKPRELLIRFVNDPDSIEGNNAHYSQKVNVEDKSGLLRLNVQGIIYNDTFISNDAHVVAKPLVIYHPIGTHTGIIKIIEDYEGNAWILTSSSILIFDGQSVLPTPKELTGFRTRKIAIDRIGNVWVDSVGEWTSMSCPTKFIVWDGTKRIAEYFVSFTRDGGGDMAFDLDNIFVGLQPGQHSSFLRLVNDSIVYEHINKCTSPSPVYGKRRKRVVFDNNNQMWISTNKGVALMDGPDCGLFNKANMGWPSEDAYAIRVDNEGAVWVQFEEHVAKYHNNHWSVEYTVEGSEDVKSIAVDNEGNLWMIMYFSSPTVRKMCDGQLVRGYGSGGTYDADIFIMSDGTVIAGGSGDLMFINERGFPPGTNF